VAEARVPVAVLAAVGERLPLAPASVDSVLLSLVLCSVDDPAVVLAEIRRVLRPAGRLLLLEHVRASEGSKLGLLQDVIDPVWSRVAGGCRPNRRTRAQLDSAGFDTSSVDDVTIGSSLPLLAVHLCGVARAPAD
jgi:ubiquinone/menaquinone biosynthesis C-methylase UbiE